MKKSIIFLSAILLAASCQKTVMEPETPVEHIRTFTASFSDLTRTSLGDDLTPLWGEGDAIWLSDGVNQEVVGVSAQDIGKATASFTTTTITGETVYALYPASCAIGKTSTWSVYFDIPSKTDGAFKNANICVAVATDDEDELNFKNATSMIRFTKSTADVVSLSVVRPDERMIAGWMSFRPLDGYFLGAGHRVVSSIEVDMSGPGPYYVALYPQPLPVGTKFVMTTSDGQSYVRTINSENEFSLNKIKTISVDAAFTGATLAPEGGWSGSGTETDPYLITSAEDLKLLSTKVAAGNRYPGVYFKVVADFSVSNYIPVAAKDSYDSFQGVFDGNYRTITINGVDASTLSSYNSNLGYDACVGLFGKVENAKIKNVRVAGSISGSSRPRYFGSVCAQAIGTSWIENCGSSLNASIDISNRMVAAGGVVGYAGKDVIIAHCYNTGNISVSSSYSSGFYAGGVCGNLYGGNIQLSFNTGNIECRSSKSGYGPFVAGVAASNTNAGMVEGCYNQGIITARGANASSPKAAGITYYVKAMYSYNSGLIKTYVGTTTTVGSAGSAVGVTYNQYGTFQHCFYWQDSASYMNNGTGGEFTDCDYFVPGDQTNGGLIGTDGRSLVDALNGYQATVYSGDPHFYASPTGDHFPILDYVSRNILDN